MNTKIGWGFIGAGNITNRFIKGLNEVPDAYLAAIASRNYDNAKAFAEHYNAKDFAEHYTVKDPAEHYSAKAYEDYEQVILDKNVDILYVATPHTLHMENTLLALELGKPVLCEKPMSPNAAQVRQMVSKSRDKKIYLMEAMWTRFFPAIHKVQSWLSEGEIGKVHHVTADFGYSADVNPSSRLFNPELAGGSLLDVGVYTVSFASMIFGKKPNRISSVADMTSTGVDSRMGCSLGYEGGGIASLFSAVSTNTLQEAHIIGEHGRIVIPKFWSPRQAFLYKDEQLVEEFSQEHVGEGFQFEIAAVQEDFKAGRIENKLMPLDESIAIAETMDTMRAQWGLVYPFEK